MLLKTAGKFHEDYKTVSKQERAFLIVGCILTGLIGGLLYNRFPKGNKTITEMYSEWNIWISSMVLLVETMFLAFMDHKDGYFLLLPVLCMLALEIISLGISYALGAARPDLRTVGFTILIIFTASLMRAYSFGDALIFTAIYITITNLIGDAVMADMYLMLVYTIAFMVVILTNIKKLIEDLRQKKKKDGWTPFTTSICVGLFLSYIIALLTTHG